MSHHSLAPGATGMRGDRAYPHPLVAPIMGSAGCWEPRAAGRRRWGQWDAAGTCPTHVPASFQAAEAPASWRGTLLGVNCPKTPNLPPGTLPGGRWDGTQPCGKGSPGTVMTVEGCGTSPDPPASQCPGELCQRWLLPSWGGERIFSNTQIFLR